MLVHRFSDYFAEQPVINHSRIRFNQTEAFVPCPVMAQLTPNQQDQIAEIYRIARERTLEQLQQIAQVQRYDFSIN